MYQTEAIVKTDSNSLLSLPKSRKIEEENLKFNYEE